MVIRIFISINFVKTKAVQTLMQEKDFRYKTHLIFGGSHT